MALPATANGVLPAAYPDLAGAHQGWLSSLPCVDEQRCPGSNRHYGLLFWTTSTARSWSRWHRWHRARTAERSNPDVVAERGELLKLIKGLDQAVRTLKAPIAKEAPEVIEDPLQTSGRAARSRSRPRASKRGRLTMQPNLDDYLTIGRRRLLKGLGLHGLVTVGGSTLFSEGLRAGPVFKEYPFRLGVASGDPASDGFVIWTRLAPEPTAGGGMPNRPVAVRWEVATGRSGSELKDVVAKGEEIAHPVLGHSLHVELTGLEPRRDYFYRFEIGDSLARERSRIGRALTLPAPGQPVPRIRFGVAGCQYFEHGYFTAFRHLADEGLDFVFHYGDYIYQGRARAVGEGELPVVRTHDLDTAYTLVDYRNRYGLYKADPDLIAAHLSAPFLASWDDHEVDSDWAGDRVQDGTPPELFVLRRAAAFQAYYEHMPLRRGSMPRTLMSMPIYRRFTFGDLAEVNVLDTRQYRTAQPCGDQVGPRCAGALDPNATILGAGQQRWLFDGLASSRARWNVLAQQVALMQRDLGGEPGAPRYHPDKWDGYVASRQALLDHLQRASVANPVALTGDTHNGWAGELKADFDDPGSRTVGVEFIATSISSGGDGSDWREETPRVLSANPHIKFFNNQRGYVSNEVTPERWTAHYRIVERVTVPDTPVKTRASFVVPPGKPGIERG